MTTEATTTPDDVLQAAERLIADAYSDGEKVTLWNFSRQKMEDLCVLARILPKGERPVPMDWTGDTAVYFTTLEFDGGSPVPGYWDIDEEGMPQVWSPFVEGPVNSKLYRTQEEAQLAIRWTMLDKLAASDAPLLR